MKKKNLTLDNIGNDITTIMVAMIIMFCVNLVINIMFFTTIKDQNTLIEKKLDKYIKLTTKGS